MTLSAAAAAAGDALLDAMLAKLATDRGVHLESAAVGLGALAGHACQVFVLRNGEAAVPELMIVSAKNGDTYYYGNAINGPLVESSDSVWAIVSGAALALGSEVPDVEELFRHAAETVGGPEFGIPRYAADTFSEPPVSFLPLWDEFRPRLDGVAQSDWSVAYALAIAALFERVSGQFPIEPLVQISMDSAIAMAKLKS